jgi:hypothetical protein
MRPQKPSANGHQRADAERRTRQTERLARVLRVLQLIQSPRRRGAQEIATELGCSERTVYRDLQVLMAEGVPVYLTSAIVATECARAGDLPTWHRCTGSRVSSGSAQLSGQAFTGENRVVEPLHRRA